MHSESGLRSIPQIFVNGKFIGTFEGLEEANEQGNVAEWLHLK
jgi:glutaredoxin-related protein